MNLHWLTTAFLCSGLVACGGGSGGGTGSGFPSNTAVADLSTSETMDLCEYLTELQGPERVIDCGDGGTVTVGVDPAALDDAIADCVASAPSGECPTTVGETESCSEAIADLTDEELCKPSETPAVCEPLFNPPASCRDIVEPPPVGV